MPCTVEDCRSPQDDVDNHFARHHHVPAPGCPVPDCEWALEGYTLSYHHRRHHQLKVTLATGPDTVIVTRSTDHSFHCPRSECSFSTLADKELRVHYLACGGDESAGGAAQDAGDGDVVMRDDSSGTGGAVAGPSTRARAEAGDVAMEEVGQISIEKAGKKRQEVERNKRGLEEDGDGIAGRPFIKGKSVAAPVLTNDSSTSTYRRPVLPPSASPSTLVHSPLLSSYGLCVHTTFNCLLCVQCGHLVPTSVVHGHLTYELSVQTGLHSHSYPTSTLVPAKLAALVKHDPPLVEDYDELEKWDGSVVRAQVEGIQLVEGFICRGEEQDGAQCFFTTSSAGVMRKHRCRGTASTSEQQPSHTALLQSLFLNRKFSYFPVHRRPEVPLVDLPPSLAAFTNSVRVTFEPFLTDPPHTAAAEAELDPNHIGHPLFNTLSWQGMGIEDRTNGQLLAWITPPAKPAPDSFIAKLSNLVGHHFIDESRWCQGQSQVARSYVATDTDLITSNELSFPKLQEGSSLSNYTRATYRLVYFVLLLADALPDLSSGLAPLPVAVVLPNGLVDLAVALVEKLESVDTGMVVTLPTFDKRRARTTPTVFDAARRAGGAEVLSWEQDRVRTEDDKQLLSLLHRLMSTLWIRRTTKREPTPFHEPVSAFLIFDSLDKDTKILERPACFGYPDNITRLCSQIKYGARLTIFVESRLRSDVSETATVLDILRQGNEPLHQYLCRSDSTPFATVAQVSSNVRSHLLGQTLLPNISWWDEPHSFQPGSTNKTIRVDDVRAFLQTLRKKMDAQLVTLLLGLDPATTLPPLSEVGDERGNRSDGFSFLSSAVNPDRERWKRTLFTHVLDDPALQEMWFVKLRMGTSTVDQITIQGPTMAKYMGTVDDFERNVLVYNHLTQGGPPRATEIASSLIKNVGHDLRTLFPYENHLVSVHTYSKTKSQTGQLKPIARLCDLFASRMLQYLLCVIRPWVVACYFAVGQRDLAHLASVSLWRGKTSEMICHDISKILTPAFPQLGTNIGISDWRHWIELFLKHVLATASPLERQLMHRTLDGEIEQPDQVVGTSYKDKQTGHSGSTASLNYARDSNDLSRSVAGSISPGDLHGLMAVSLRAQAFLGVGPPSPPSPPSPPIDDALPAATAAAFDLRTVVSVTRAVVKEEQATAIATITQGVERAFVTSLVDVQSSLVERFGLNPAASSPGSPHRIIPPPSLVALIALQATFNDTRAKFRTPAQGAAITRLIEGERSGIYVDATGNGKSMLFTVPLQVLKRSSRLIILVTPLIATVQDAIKNVQNFGIVVEEFKAGMSHESIPSNTQLVVVIYDTVCTSSFQAYVNYLIRLNLLHAFVIDEFQCCQLESTYRLPMRRVSTILVQFAIPRWYITATYPPSLEPRVFVDHSLNPSSIYVYRHPSTARTNISYNFLPLVLDMTMIKDAVDRWLTRPGEWGMVFVATRNAGYQLRETLRKEQKIEAEFYHGGVEVEERNAILGRLELNGGVLIATNESIGLGFNARQGRFAFLLRSHFESIVKFEQLCGRLGRDQLPSIVVVFTGQSAFPDSKSSSSNELIPGDYSAMRALQDDPVCHRRHLAVFLDGQPLADGSLCVLTGALLCGVCQSAINKLQDPHAPPPVHPFDTLVDITPDFIVPPVPRPRIPLPLSALDRIQVGPDTRRDLGALVFEQKAELDLSSRLEAEVAIFNVAASKLLDCRGCAACTIWALDPLASSHLVAGSEAPCRHAPAPALLAVWQGAFVLVQTAEVCYQCHLPIKSQWHTVDDEDDPDPNANPFGPACRRHPILSPLLLAMFELGPQVRQAFSCEVLERFHRATTWDTLEDWARWCAQVEPRHSGLLYGHLAITWLLKTYLPSRTSPPQRHSTLANTFPRPQLAPPPPPSTGTLPRLQVAPAPSTHQSLPLPAPPLILPPTAAPILAPPNRRPVADSERRHLNMEPLPVPPRQYAPRDPLALPLVLDRNTIRLGSLYSNEVKLAAGWTLEEMRQVGFNV